VRLRGGTCTREARSWPACSCESQGAPDDHMKAKLALALVAAVCCSVCQSAHSQTGKRKAPPALELDAAPSPESDAPDPLAPPQSDTPAPLAPGASAVAPQATEPAEADPLVLAVRGQLAASSVPRGAGDREDQAALAAFYAERTRPVWIEKGGLSEQAKLAIAEISKADDWGLKVTAFELPPIAPSTDIDSLSDTEIKLSRAVLKYARHARGGRLDPPSVSRMFDQKPRVYEPKSVMLGIVGSGSADVYLRGLHPKHEQFVRLRRALMVARSGVAGTRSAQNVQLIVANMERWRWMPDDLGGLYVWDSVPEQIVRVVDNGKVVFAEKIVVGRPTTPTPIFSADMLFIIFHPSWGVPTGIKTQELWPRLRDSGGGWFSTRPLASSVLSSYGLQVTRGGVPVDPDAVDWTKVDIRSYDFVQPPGPRNVLGIVKFRFPNKHDVYMHDTPERHLFGNEPRAFSHGCMRVQNPVQLAEVLLAHDKGWSTAQVQGYVKRGGEIRLTTPIPVHVTYFTATVDDNDNVRYFGDIYGLDSRVASALEGQPVALRMSGTTEDPPVRTGPGARSKSPVRRTGQPPSNNPFAAIFGN
jgi:L,D-transpeptidase YcbB